MRRWRLIGALVALALGAAAVLSIAGGESVSAGATHMVATIVCDDSTPNHVVVQGSTAGGAPSPTAGSSCAGEIKEQLDAGLGLKRATTPGDGATQGAIYVFVGRA